jgi:hypothetical protein
MNSWRDCGIALLVLGSLVACVSKGHRDSSKDQKQPGTTAASGAPSAAAESPKVVERRKPSGPAFPVEAGVGLGPIRFGSTVATVERHMQTKCEELTERVCRFITSGIELELTNGAVSGMVINRLNRPVLPVDGGKPGSEERRWGAFEGGIPPNVFMMMVPEAVIEQIGKPKKSEAVKEENPNWTVRRDYYDGMVLEYDKNRANDRLMLGQVRIVKR